jgi:hypothetical protein
MDYLIVVFVSWVMVVAGRQFKDNRKNVPVSVEQLEPGDENFTAEKIEAYMFKYWRLRCDNAKSLDEGGACLVAAGKSVDFFKASIGKTLGVLNEQEQETRAIQESTNVVSIVPE